MLDERKVGEHLDLNNIICIIYLGYDATSIIGKIFIVTETGKYFMTVHDKPEANLGIIRIAGDSKTAELL